jgi:hypothetical protein
MFSLDRKKVEKVFSDYANNYDLSDVKIHLKAVHTYHVAENADRIAESIGLERPDRDLAWLLGMLHDIGRFEQLRQYHTFTDGISVNHAMLSADILFGKDHFKADDKKDRESNRPIGCLPDDASSKQAPLIRSFIDDPSKDPLIEKAIRLHNVFRLPVDLTEREQTYCDILRDADKIDIFRVNVETPRTEIYDLTEEEFLTSDLSDEVFQSVMDHQNVLRRPGLTAIDKIVSHFALVYGLVYRESIVLTKEQGYLDQMLQTTSENLKTEEKLSKIRDEIRKYMEERIR